MGVLIPIVMECQLPAVGYINFQVCPSPRLETRFFLVGVAKVAMDFQ